ncbi:MAG: hypothetical protein GX593_13075 [Actinomycetales bacterium]|nr:hypothetical protein [Actinomycetales bacterium]
MTATLIPPAPSPLLRPPAGTVLPSGARWAPVTETLWAGTRDGEFLGTVEFVDGGFETTNEHGVRIGRSHSLLAAQRLVDGPPVETTVLTWREERAGLAAGWIGFSVLAGTAVVLAANLFL